MNKLLLLLTACLPINSSIVEDRVDVIEVNHFYDEEGRLVFDQIIFWEWCPVTKRHQVVAWRLLKKYSAWPERRGREWQSMWIDGELLRRVIAPSIRETWTQYDPELEERKLLRKEHRRELTQCKRPT